MTNQELSQRIKQKYPQYQNMEDGVLVEKITTKYPQYKAQLEPQGMMSELGGYAKETLGDVGEFATGIYEAGKKRLGNIQQGAEGYQRGEQGLLRTLAQGAGQGLGFFGDVVGEGLIGAGKALLPSNELEQQVGGAIGQGAQYFGVGAKAIGDVLGISPYVSKGLEAVEQAKISDPALGRDISAAAGAIDALTNLIGAGAATKGAKAAARGAIAAERAGKGLLTEGVGMLGKTAAKTGGMLSGGKGMLGRGAETLAKKIAGEEVLGLSQKELMKGKTGEYLLQKGWTGTAKDILGKAENEITQSKEAVKDIIRQSNSVHSNPTMLSNVVKRVKEFHPEIPDQEIIKILQNEKYGTGRLLKNEFLDTKEVNKIREYIDNKVIGDKGWMSSADNLKKDTLKTLANELRENVKSTDPRLTGIFDNYAKAIDVKKQLGEEVARPRRIRDYATTGIAIGTGALVNPLAGLGVYAAKKALGTTFIQSKVANALYKLSKKLGVAEEAAKKFSRNKNLLNATFTADDLAKAATKEGINPEQVKLLTSPKTLKEVKLKVIKEVDAEHIPAEKAQGLLGKPKTEPKEPLLKRLKPVEQKGMLERQDIKQLPEKSNVLKTREEIKLMKDITKDIKKGFSESEEGYNFIQELEAKQATKPEFNEKIASGIKGNPHFWKEKEFSDKMANGYLMTKGDKNAIIGADELEKYSTKGWKKGPEIDSLAKEAGFDSGEEYLAYTLEASNNSPMKSISKEVNDYLMANNSVYKDAIEEINKLKNQLYGR